MKMFEYDLMQARNNEELRKIVLSFGSPFHKFKYQINTLFDTLAPNIQFDLHAISSLFVQSYGIYVDWHKGAVLAGDLKLVSNQNINRLYLSGYDMNNTYEAIPGWERRASPPLMKTRSVGASTMAMSFPSAAILPFGTRGNGKHTFAFKTELRS